MDSYKKVFIEDGLSGISFIAIGIALQFSNMFSVIISLIYNIVCLALIITIVIVKIRTRKRRLETVDELAEINIMKAKTFVFEFILALGLGITLFMHFCCNDSFQINLNWYIYMIIYGCCQLSYSILAKGYANISSSDE